jgi:membrane associated rhomboid family serine protease
VEFNVEPRRWPLVTLGLVAACALAGLLQLAVGEEAWLAWGLRATEVLSGRGWLTLFTSMFLHASAVHFLVNMYFLYILGDNVEDALGHWPFLFFYLACGLLAEGAWLLLNPASDILLVGASGAIAGVMAAYLILYREARLTFMLIFWQFKVPAWIWLGAWFGFQLVGLFVDPEAAEGGVAFLGHVGGFLAGALLIWPFEEAILRRNPLLRLLRERLTRT